MIEAFTAFDARILQFLYDVRDPLFVQIFIWISELGRGVIVYGLATACALILVLYRRYSYALGLAVATASSGILTLLIKGLFERDRPDVLFQAYLEVWYSFPSGHAALAAALYGFLIYVVWQLGTSAQRVIASVGLSLLIICIAFSRLYLGVHFAIDVVAGLLLGGVAVILGAYVQRRVSKE